MSHTITRRTFAALTCAALITTPTAIAEAHTVHTGDAIHTKHSPHGRKVTTCTLGPVLDESTATTAAHCGYRGALVRNSDGVIIGKRGRAYPGVDVARVHLSAPHRGVPTPIADEPMEVGETVRKDGALSGSTSGEVQVTGASITLQGSPAEFGSSSRGMTTGALVDMCAQPGDSGAPVWRGGEVVGVVSAVTAAPEGGCGVGEASAFVTDVVGLF